MNIPPEHLVKTSNHPPAGLMMWLNYQDSLTAKLKADCGEAQLELLSQYWTRANWWDRYMLGLPRETVLHRNILMFSHKTPYWFARTIIPQPTYQTNSPFFARLAYESLGEIIFNEPSIKRIQLLNYAIDETCIEYHWLPTYLTKEKQLMWVRLAMFTIAETSVFYLAEILFPQLLKVNE